MTTSETPQQTTEQTIAILREAKARQRAELEAIEAVLPALIAIQGRYRSGSREAGKISTQARKAGEAIETILSLTQGWVER